MCAIILGAGDEAPVSLKYLSCLVNAEAIVPINIILLTFP